MDCTRTHRIVAHVATAGALLICVAVIGGVGRTQRVAPQEAYRMTTSDTPAWTTSSFEPAAEPAAAPATPGAAPEAAEAPTAVADLPPPIMVSSIGHASQLSEAPPAESDTGVVGLWVPDASSCSLRSFRQGLLPTIINTEGAWAGETFCVFKSRKPTESGWRVVAECSSGDDHWTTQVRLSLKGQRLVWESKRGRQVYTRCSTDLRMAAAP